MRSSTRILLCCSVLTGIVGVLLVIGGSAQCAGLAAEAQYAAQSQAATGGPADKDTLCLLRFLLPQDWPEYVTNGDPLVVLPISFINECPWEAQIESIVPEEIGGSGWLSVPSGSLTLPPNSQTVFNIQVIPPPPGSPRQWLEGYVHFTSSAWEGDTWPLHIKLYAADVIADPAYDTVATSTAWGSKDANGLGDNTALVVSNFGEIGNSGEGGVNLDFTVDGNECNEHMDQYLYASSPFYIQKTGTDYSLTTYHHTAGYSSQWKPGSWVAATGTVMSKGLGSHDGVSYDSVYAGESFNRDTTVAIERTFYAPRGNTSNPSFVVARTKLYSVGGVTREHIAFGTATDWDIPSDIGAVNTSAISIDEYVFFQGTDTTTTNHCQSNLLRFGAEVLSGWYTQSEFAADSCVNNTEIVGMRAVNVRDYFDDDSLTGEPDAQLWWTATGAGGYAGEPSAIDQGGFVTFVHDYTLAANDTLTFWTIMATQRKGTLTQFEANIDDAKTWCRKLRVPCEEPFVCGDIDGDGLITMDDLIVFQDHMFISHTPLPDPRVADVDGYPGVTNNDFMAFWVWWGQCYPIFEPLYCSPYVGTSFPVSNDILELRNTTVLPGSSQATVEVWLDLDKKKADGLAFPFSYRSSNPLYTVTLEQKGEEYGKSEGPSIRVDRDGRGLLFNNYQTMDTIPFRVANLVFNVSPIPTDAFHIIIDTSDYPPSHTTVLSREYGCGAVGVRPHFIAYGDTTISPIADAYLDTVGSTVYVRNIDSTGNNGVRVPGYEHSTGIDIKYTDLDLSLANRSVRFDLFGDTDAKAELQRVSGVGVYQDTGGTIQVLADYTLIGDPNVLVRVYNGAMPAGEALIAGGGIVAVGQDMGYGLPQIVGTNVRILGDPTFAVEFSVPLKFKLMDGPTLYGNTLYLISTGATEEVLNFSRVDVTGANLISFGLYDIDRSVCCAGMRGNADCSPDDFVTMGDLTFLIDHLYISLAPLCCEEEAELDGESPITMGDLTRMIDYLYITLTPLPACP